VLFTSLMPVLWGPSQIPDPAPQPPLVYSDNVTVYIIPTQSSQPGFVGPGEGPGVRELTVLYPQYVIVRPMIHDIES